MCTGIRPDHAAAFSQRLESLGRLAGGVAHDFNNLLMVLGGSAEQARRALPDGSPAEPALERILTAVERAGELTRDLLAFAGHGGVRSRPFDLNAAALELIRLGGTSLPDGARIETRLAPELPPVHGDPSAAQRILLNLLLNAAEALGDVGTRVEVSTRIADADDLARASACGGRGGEGGEPETWAALEVADDGVGMEAETRRRIFDPFYSTRPDGRGLGLATVRGIVASHGGKIAVRSEPGQGTRFTVLLPAGTAPAPEGREDAEPEVEGFRGGGTALVVDDEPGVRQVLRAMLTDLGFDVLEADGGRAALELHAGEGGRFAFTLLDLSMPDLDGVEARRRILARDPDARVILMSGFSEAADQSELGEVFLRKPFLRSDVVRCLRALSR